MGVWVLGPLTVDGRGPDLAPRDRVVLSALAMQPGEPVSAERLADALWRQALPTTWPKVVQGSIARLRKVLGSEAIRTTPQGYVLALAADAIDTARFDRGVRRARELLEVGQPERARFVVAQALDLWRGPVLADLEDWEPADAVRQHWAELRQEAEELRVDAALQAGDWREVLAEAASLVAEQPLRELRWGLLARAQYQAGRQGEALDTLRRARATLAEELGLDPGPELAALERAILAQDPVLLADRYVEARSGCPYRGLLAYDVGDAEEFFGRDDEVTACRRVLEQRGVLAVVGPSGCGKSSLVRAGVAAAVGREGRTVTVLTPGAHPLAALAEHMSRQVEVIVVDQIEEVATVCSDPQEQEAFLDALVRHAESGTALVVALRADRLGLLTGHYGFARLLERGMYLLGAMGEQQLRAAIEEPARRAGLLLEQGLVDLLVTEVSGQSGALPLMSHALARTWGNREGRTLTLDGYRATGGIRGAVTQSAEVLFQDLGPAGRRALRDLMLRLVAVSPDGQAVRSPVPRRVVDSDIAVESLLEVLVHARLISTDGQVVELAHESLVGAWPRLRSWLDEDVEGQRILRHITVAADTWQAMGRPTSELYRGARLARALAWRDEDTAVLTATEHAFLDAARDLAEGEARSAEQRLDEQTRTNRRLRVLLGGVAAVLVIAVVAGAVAVGEGRRADAQATVAQVRELAAASRAVRAADPELGILLAMAATSLSEAGSDGPAREALEALHGAVVSSRVDLVVPDRGGPVAWSPAGDVFVTPGPPDSGRVEVRDAQSGDPVFSFDAHQTEVTDVAFGPDGLLATAGGEGAVRVWDHRDGRLVSQIAGAGPARGLSFHQDSGRLAAAWPDENVIRVADAGNGDVRLTTEVSEGPWSTSLSPDGATLAVATISPTVSRILDAATGDIRHRLDGHEDVDPFVQHSPDGSWIATAGEDGTIRVRASDTGATVHVLRDFISPVRGLAWAPDSTRLAAGGTDSVVRVFDVTASEAALAFTVTGGANATPAGLAFSPDGTRLLSGDQNAGAATVWDLTAEGDAEVVNLPGNASRTWSDAEYTADGHLATTTGEGTVTVWDTAESSEVTVLAPDGAQEADDVRAIAVSPDGTMLAAGDSETARVWDLATGTELFQHHAPGGFVSRPAFSPDSTLVALANNSASVRLYDRGGAPKAVFRADADTVLTDPAFSPDGTTLAVTQLRPGGVVSDFRLLLWDWQSDTTRSWPEASWRDITGIRAGYSPDGQRLAITNVDGPAEIRDAESGETLLTLDGHAAGVTDVAFSPDARLVATASIDGTARVWDADTGDAVLRLPWQPGEVTSVAFSPDGRHLATSTGPDGEVRVWTLDADELVSIAQAKVTRTLTTAECREYLHTSSCP